MDKFIKETNEINKLKMMIDKQAAEYKAARLEEENKRLKKALADVKALVDRTPGLPFRFLMDMGKITQKVKELQK